MDHLTEIDKIQRLYDEGQDCIDIAEEMNLTVEYVDSVISNYLQCEDDSDDIIGFATHTEED
jgi:hypothetical protein